MEPSRPDKPTKPAVQPTPVVDTSQLFQKDAAPVITNPKQNLFARLGKKKLLLIGVALGVSILIGGIAYAQFRKPDSKPTDQQSAAEQAESTATEKQNGDTSQNPSDQTTSPEGTSAPSNTTAPSTSGTSGGSSTGGTGSTTSPPSTGGGTSSTAPKTYDISYTNSCYDPANVTIKKNDTVKFTNNSTNNMEPASNNHPSHTLYSEFDANNNIAPGGTYSFTFTKTGSWGYHDHSKPNCTGTITVQ